MKSISAKSVGTIYETTDYDAFTFINFNRNAKPRKDLMDALEENGKFFEPIIVNSNLEVLDGQHRLLSAKAKKAPISFYIVDDSTSKQVIRSVNTERKNWSLREYIDFYAKLGDKNYQTLIQYMDSPTTSRLAESTIHEALAGKRGQFSKIKNGNYKIGNLNSVDMIFEFMNEVMGNHKGKMGVRLARTLTILLMVEEIDQSRLYKLLTNKKTYEQIKAIGSEGKVLDYVMSLYNRNLTTNYIEYYFDKRGIFRVVK